MSLKWQEAREKVITYARKLQAERLVYSTAGNISMRIPAEPGLLACTPASTQYDLLEPADIAIVTLDGDQVDGRSRPPRNCGCTRCSVSTGPRSGPSCTPMARP